MDLWESARVALDALAHNKLRSGLTMLGIVIGVFAVISLVSLGHGAQKYVAKEFAGMGSNLLLVTPGKRETFGGGPMIGAQNVHKLTLEDSDAIGRRVPSVSGVAPIIFGLGLVKIEAKSRNCMVVGTGAEFPDVRNIRPATGSFFGEDDVDAGRRVVVIGALVRRELFGDENPLGRYLNVMGTPFRVIGVMERRGVSLGFDLDDLVFIPVSAARRLFNTDALAEVMVQARSEALVDRAADEVRALLMERHGGVEDVTVITQGQMLSTLNTILDVLTATLAGIAGISLIVGGIGIMNIMLVSVRERTREIGVRKAIGARSRDILVQFLVESVVLSLIGGAIGVVLAFGVQVAAHLVISDLPIAITPWAVTLAVVFSAAIGIFFGVFPARRASRLNPIEALRTE
jgi:putative ABC transport system permease protein